jgi:hypothetical protein
VTASTLTLTPGAPSPAPGAGAIAEPPDAASPTVLEAIERAAREDYARWLRHTASAGGCSRPVRLWGGYAEINPATGEVVDQVDTTELPDGVIYTACGNRRAEVCPACAEVYRADTYHLIRAGMTGGKGVPATVAEHPALFLTATAPSFGPVHSRRVKGGHGSGGRVLPCRPARRPKPCPHGVDLRCQRAHRDDDARLGEPLCPDCYDHQHQAVWNAYVSSELWRRTMQTARRALDALAKAHGTGRVRPAYAKVAEFQRRGVAHFHAIIRADGQPPRDHPDGTDAILPPPAWCTPQLLAAVYRRAFAATAYTTPPHPARPEGWPLMWGDAHKGLDVRVVRAPGGQEISESAVAGYLAKYATKATETTGHLSARITRATIGVYADDTHTGRLIAACWRLGTAPGDPLQPPEEWESGYGRMRRWAHMLGFGGHFTTKSRRYSTTYGVERERRRAWRRRHNPHTGSELVRRDDDLDDEDTTLIIGTLAFAGIGWRTTGDALLATSAAARAREHRRVAREESRTTLTTTAA